jgi:hypothetical protein
MVNGNPVSLVGMRVIGPIIVPGQGSYLRDRGQSLGALARRPQREKADN